MCFKEPDEMLLAFNNGYIPVFRNDEFEIEWAYEPIRGMYCGWLDEGYHSSPDFALWPKEFSSRTGWLDVREPPYLVYKPKGTTVVGNRPYRTHIVHDGRVCCNRSMSVPSPDSDELTPLSEFTEEELDELRWEMCANCPTIDFILSENDG